MKFTKWEKDISAVALGLPTGDQNIQRALVQKSYQQERIQRAKEWRYARQKFSQLPVSVRKKVLSVYNDDITQKSPYSLAKLVAEASMAIPVNVLPSSHQVQLSLIAEC